ncbi:outer membrane beta-barrel protein [Winogradskyella haliclonae]|nr:outer membrane beta-barrel protein [Winogradskyella haliclonae]
MKNYTLFIIALMVSCTCLSQQLYFEIGTTISSFDYENSQGQPLDNLLSTSKTYYGMGYRQSINPSKTLFLSLGATYNNYGAIGSENSVNNFFEWDVSYLGLKAGMSIQLFQLRDLYFFANVSVSPEIMVRGNQTINNAVFNLVGNEEFNNTIVFFRGGLEMQYPVSKYAAISAVYNYGKTTLANSGSTQEKLGLNAHQFGIGFIINLPNCNCDF